MQLVSFNQGGPAAAAGQHCGMRGAKLHIFYTAYMGVITWSVEFGITGQYDPGRFQHIGNEAIFSLVESLM